MEMRFIYRFEEEGPNIAGSVGGTKGTENLNFQLLRIKQHNGFPFTVGNNVIDGMVNLRMRAR